MNRMTFPHWAIWQNYVAFWYGNVIINLPHVRRHTQNNKFTKAVWRQQFFVGSDASSLWLFRKDHSVQPQSWEIYGNISNGIPRIKHECPEFVSGDLLVKAFLSSLPWASNGHPLSQSNWTSSRLPVLATCPPLTNVTRGHWMDGLSCKPHFLRQNRASDPGGTNKRVKTLQNTWKCYKKSPNPIFQEYG